MTCIEIQSKTLLRKMRRPDPWFIGSRGMNLYRGCAHDCAYCDGRAEKYRVEGAFGSEIQVKVNAASLLEKELTRSGRGLQRELWPPGGTAPRERGGFVVLGGGVGDSYQEAEKRYEIARSALLVLERLHAPVHVLTKSDLVLRDVDVLGRMAREGHALVSFSLSTARDEIASVFEPGASPPSRRLAALAELRAQGIPGGIFLVPVIPFVSDHPEAIAETLSAAARAGALYTLFGGMTLKHGRQMDHFLSTLRRVRPEAVSRVASLYPGPRPGRPDWGNASRAYYARLTRSHAAAAAAMRLPPRVPRGLFEAVLGGDALEGVLLEHVRTMRGPVGEPEEGPEEEEQAMKAEIAATGTCRAYERLLARYLVT